MLFGPIRVYLKAALGTISGVQTLWKDEPRPWVENYVCLLTIRSVTRRGTAEMPYLESPDPVTPGEELSVWERSVKEFTLEIRVESLTHSDSLTAWEFVERIRSAVERPSWVRSFSDNALGLIQVLDGTVLEETIDERVRSIALVELRLRHGYAVDTGERETNIETAGFTGTYEE